MVWNLWFRMRVYQIILILLTKEQLLPGIRAKLLSPEGVEINGYNQPGELVVQSHSVVLGYLNNEKANKETFIEDTDGRGRWMRTGDEAEIRKAASGNEHVVITDRIKELIKVKASKFYLYLYIYMRIATWTNYHPGTSSSSR